MNEHVTIAVKDIKPNPHRNFSRNPLREEQVLVLMDSIERTGFWDNVVVRPDPEHPGLYELAYGHTRLEAVRRKKIKEVTLPVRDLSYWDMYAAMVDENETQAEITVSVIMENVQVGLGLIEKAFHEIGDEGTWEQFNVALGRAVEISTAQKHKKDHTFETARNAFFRGEGIGRVFVEIILPTKKLGEHAISDSLSSLFGEARAQSKEQQATIAEQEAEQEEQQAAVEVNETEAKAKRERAKAKRDQAQKLREEAKRIGEGAIHPDILCKLANAYQMRCFTAAIKAAKVPKKFHQQALEHIQAKGITAGKPMMDEIADWWHTASGQEAKEQRQAHQRRAYDKFRRRTKGGDLRAFLIGLMGKVKALDGQIQVALTAAKFYEDKKHAQSVGVRLRAHRKLIDQLITDLEHEGTVSGNGRAVPLLPVTGEVG